MTTSRSCLCWIGILCAAACSDPAPVRAQQTPPSEPELIVADLPTDPAAIVAVVGQTPILLADLLPKIDARIRMAIAKSGGQQPPEDQLKIARTNMARGLLVQAIQNKMMRESFLLQQVGTQTSQQRAEADAKLTQRARQMFRENELPELMKQYECSDLAELDDKLSAKGSSLLLRQSDFIDMMLGHLYISGNVDKEPEVSMAEIVGYYREHQEEYMKPDRARWEQLSAHFDKAGSREEAWKWINTMALEALYGGNLQAVARKMSHGSYANQGGVHDWTAKGSLVSEPINATIFLIPENKMSEIIEDQRGFHVVRVLGRKAAGYTPLAEVQDEIRNTIQKQKIAKSQEKTLRRMHKMIPVWSMFPGDIPGAMPLPGTAAPTPVQNSAPVQNRASVQNRDTGNTRPRYTARANP